MMVVLLVSLLLMSMIVPIFRVSTQTVQKVERKLAVYEAARNVLDLVEADIQLAITSEKGEHFSIKHVTWLDTDPFTPASPATVIQPGVSDPVSIAYKQSRRVSDALNYIRLEGHGTNSNWVPSMRQFPGGKIFPMTYPALDANYPEAWKCSMRSTLLYQHDFEMYQEQDADASQQRWTRPEQLSDVSQSELCFIYETVAEQWDAGTAPNYITRYFDPVPNNFGPGREVKVPHSIEGNSLAITRQRRLGEIKVMDLATAYWDDTQRQFVELPENTVVYFFPVPKAVRVTITVCDAEKRDALTLCRVIQLPCGSGDGKVILNAGNAADTAYYTDKLQPNNSINAVFNRTKYLPLLPNAFNGDGSRGAATDDDTCTENSIVTQDGVKPINWP